MMCEKKNDTMGTEPTTLRLTSRSTIPAPQAAGGAILRCPRASSSARSVYSQPLNFDRSQLAQEFQFAVLTPILVICIPSSF